MSEISTYMNDIGLYPLLTLDEEREIALKAKFGDREAQEKLVTSNLRLVVKMAKKYSNIGLYPLLTLDEEREIALKAKFGDREAQEKLVTSNLRLVVKMAKKYSNLGIPLLDIIQEGNMGLIRAAEKFDPEKNLRFTTYAAFWIKQSILKHINSNRGLIRLPAYIYDGISKVSKFIQEYTFYNICSILD